MQLCSFKYLKVVMRSQCNFPFSRLNSPSFMVLFFSMVKYIFKKPHIFDVLLENRCVLKYLKCCNYFAEDFPPIYPSVRELTMRRISLTVRCLLWLRSWRYQFWIGNSFCTNLTCFSLYNYGKDSQKNFWIFFSSPDNSISQKYAEQHGLFGKLRLV